MQNVTETVGVIHLRHQRFEEMCDKALGTLIARRTKLKNEREKLEQALKAQHEKEIEELTQQIMEENRGWFRRKLTLEECRNKATRRYTYGRSVRGFGASVHMAPRKAFIEACFSPKIQSVKTRTVNNDMSIARVMQEQSAAAFTENDFVSVPSELFCKLQDLGEHATKKEGKK